MNARKWFWISLIVASMFSCASATATTYTEGKLTNDHVDAMRSMWIHNLTLVILGDAQGANIESDYSNVHAMIATCAMQPTSQSMVYGVQVLAQTERRNIDLAKYVDDILSFYCSRHIKSF